MSKFKFICKYCGFIFEKDSDEFFVSYGCVKECNCPKCNKECCNYE